MELTSLSTYVKAFEINCVSAVSVYQATLPALRKTGGRIVLLSSMGGRAAFPFLSHIATKFALEGLGDVMRREAGPQGVKVSLRETAATPEEIAAVVVEALDAPEPESRYVAGADAKTFFQMTRAMSDREVDEIFRQMFLT
jgi:NAD(P)-dependent dehydrogenase (short-subunit alcohol dehydrogenase family)